MACESCRRRKIRCDRYLPQCSICRKFKSECNYPLKALKPGPKLGTSRRKPKRLRTRLSEDGNESGYDEDSGYGAPKVVPSAPNRASASSFESLTTLPSGALERRSRAADALEYTSSQNSMTHGYAPLSPEASLSPATSIATPLDILSLTHIVHPSHETATNPLGGGDKSESLDHGRDTASPGKSNIISHACRALELSREALERYIDLYFEHMTAFSLFHQPSFRVKLQSIRSPKHLTALLASMFSFSTRFGAVNFNAGQQDVLDGSSNSTLAHDHFASQAQKHVDDALEEWSDEAPPLCLLQALVLVTFQQLIKGVRGKAWRRLGICLRLAYELHLHLIDSTMLGEDDLLTESEVTNWCADEERRRLWWTIWEMDNFASTIRRYPTTIDGSQNKTCLPVADELWFNRRFQPSCFLELKPMDRWKALQKSGNDSPKAWFIIINSLMHDGQRLSNLGTVLDIRRPPSKRQPSRSNTAEMTTMESKRNIAERLTILENALRCFTLALPKSLKYQEEYLSFTSKVPAEVVMERQSHSSKYSIYLMTQLAKFMVYHRDAFAGAAEDLHLVNTADGNKNDQRGSNQREAGPLRLSHRHASKALDHYMEAADNTLTIVSRSSNDHVRYVNPFLANIIWFAAAVQLGYKVLAPLGTNEELEESKFEVLRLNFNAYVSTWNVPIALQQNLDALEENLQRFRYPRKVTNMQYAKTDGNNHDNDTMGCATDNRNTNTGRESQPHRPATVARGTTSAFHSAIGGGGGRGITAVPTSEADQHQRAESQRANSILTDPPPLTCAPAIDTGYLDTGERSNHASDEFFDVFGMDMDFGADAGLPFYLNGVLTGSYVE